MNGFSEIPGRRRLRRDAGLHLLLGLIGLGAISLALSHFAGLSSRVIWQAAAVYGAIALAFWPMLAWHLPFVRFGSANRVTLVRAVLVAALAGLVGTLPAAEKIAWLIVLVGAIALLLDGLDGWLARRSGMATRFGARFDQELDNLLILVLGALAVELDKAGPWILAAGLLRYLFLGLRLLSDRFAQPLPPSRRRQTFCVVQILALVVCLLPAVPPPASQLIAAAGLIGLGVSFGCDIGWVLRHSYDKQGVKP